MRKTRHKRPPEFWVEIQNADDGADFKRARFHGAMIEAHSLKAGQDFSELPECYVIFIKTHTRIPLALAMWRKRFR